MPGRAARTTGLLLGGAASGAATGLALGAAWHTVSGNHNAPWILGRAAGISAYLLLVTLVGTGLLLSHPWRARWRRPTPPTRLRLHLSLSAFTLAFTTLHVLVLATDRYAGIGWQGALLPLGATYRPIPVTLGLIGLYAGLAAGLTAAFAGRLAHRLWWPIHKLAASTLILIWLHGVLAGSDTPTLRILYLSTGALIALLAASRYTTRTPADRIAQAPRTRTIPMAPATPDHLKWTINDGGGRR